MIFKYLNQITVIFFHTRFLPGTYPPVKPVFYLSDGILYKSFYEKNQNYFIFLGDSLPALSL